MASNKLLRALLLWPISKIYGGVVAVRNAMFNRGILHQHSFGIPVVVVGNIAVGGSGKTPHTEYIVEALHNQYNIAVLSRGYKRRTRGFLLATPQTSADDLGDESYQIYQKFRSKGVTVAVCEDRVSGIRELQRIDPKINMVVLDDAFQHRYVKPSVAVVLMEFSRPAYDDHFLPYGRLREPMSALNRADVIIVTKCPDDMKPVDTRIFSQKLNLFPYQKLLFSSYSYQPLEPVFAGEDAAPPMQLSRLTPDDSILSVTGIANPRPFVRYLRRYKAKVRIKRYGDHHHFSRADIDSIDRKFTTMSGKKKIIVTTEKDAVRLRNNPHYPARLRRVTYYLPITVRFTEHNELQLDEIINQQIRTNRIFKH